MVPLMKIDSDRLSILQWTATERRSEWEFSTSGVNMGYQFNENPIIVGVTQDMFFSISSAPTNGQDTDTLTYIILLYIRNPIIYSSLFSIESLFQPRACVFSLPFQIRSQESSPLCLNATRARIYKFGTSWKYKCTFLLSKLYF